jgi:hypothetical protein
MNCPSASMLCHGNSQIGPPLKYPIDVQLCFTCSVDGWSVTVECPYNEGLQCKASYHEGVLCLLVGSAQRPCSLNETVAAEISRGAAPAIATNQVIREARAQERIKHTCEYCGHQGSIDVMYPGWPECSHCNCSVSLKTLMALRYGECTTK